MDNKFRNEIEAALIETEKRGHRQKLDALFQVINENSKLAEVLIGYREFSKIRDSAGQLFVDKDARTILNKRRLTLEETKQVYLLETFIAFLNRAGLLRELPKFDYTTKYDGENS